MSENKQRRAFRWIVWSGRVFGWARIALALLNAAQTGSAAGIWKRVTGVIDCPSVEGELQWDLTRKRRLKN